MRIDKEHILSSIREAGSAVMGIYDTDFAVEQKEDKSPVTEADTRAHNMLMTALGEFGYPILSEEGDSKESARYNAQHVWIIDPLDGTNDFVQKTGEFSIMVGLVEDGKPVFGAVYAPAVDKLYYAQSGSGAWLSHGGETTRLSVDTRTEHIRAVSSRSHNSPEIDAYYKALGAHERIAVGSNGVKIGRIAEGEADVFYNPTSKMGEWDGCAPQIILEEAGGKMTGADGSPIVYNKKDPHLSHGILATNGALHPKATYERGRTYII